MSNPRAMAQVVTAASALEGAGVTLDVSNASYFNLGQLVELYPSQYGDGAPLARAGATVRFLISNILGQTLTGEMNPDAYLNPPLVEVGWLVDGTSGTSGDTSGDEELVDNVNYPFSRSGIVAAIAAASARAGGSARHGQAIWVNIAGGQGDLVVDPPIERASNVGVRTGPGTRLLLLPGNVDSKVFLNEAAITAGSLISVAANRGVSVTTLAAGGVAANGIVVGSLCRIADTTTSVRHQINVVRDVTGDVIEWEKPLAFDFTTADVVKRFTAPLINSPLACAFYANGNTHGSAGGTKSFAVVSKADLFCDYSRCTFEGFSGSGFLGYGGAMLLQFGFGDTVRDCRDKLSGSGGNAAFQFDHMWACKYHDLDVPAEGFGILWNFCGQSEAYSAKAYRCNGRCIKAENCRDMDFYACEGSGATSAYSGIMIDGPETLNVNWHDPRTFGNAAVGIQTDATGVRQVRIFNPQSEDNGTYQIYVPGQGFDCEVHNPMLGHNGGSSGFFFGATGVARGVRYTASTTNATPQVIAAIPGLVGTTTIVAHFKGRYQGGGGGAAVDGAGFGRVATMTGDGAAVATQMGATTAVYAHQNAGTAAWAAEILVGGDGAQLRVTGEASNNINWDAVVDIERVN